MTTKQPDQNNIPLIEAVTAAATATATATDTATTNATSVEVPVKPFETVEDAIADNTPNPNIGMTIASTVDTAGLNSLSEAAMKGIRSTSSHGGHDDTGTDHNQNQNPNEESKSIAVGQVRDQTLDVMMAAAAATSGTTETYASKIDLVLSKLDTILVRLDRIEAMTTTTRTERSSPTTKAATNRPVRPRVKNTCPSMMKTLQGAPIHEMNLHFYDNEYHVLPEGWVLPRLSFEGLMEYWYLGDPSSKVPPLINVGGTEFKSLPRGVRKRSDMKYLMKHVERKARELGCYIDNINNWSIESVRNLYARTRQFFEYPNKSSAQTKFDKLSWETICHNLRRNKGVLLGEESHTGTGVGEVEDVRETGDAIPNQMNDATGVHGVNEVPTPQTGTNGDNGRSLMDEMDSPIPIPAPETPAPGDIQIIPETITPATITPATNTMKGDPNNDNDVVMESVNAVPPSEEPKDPVGTCSV